MAITTSEDNATYAQYATHEFFIIKREKETLDKGHTKISLILTIPENALHTNDLGHFNLTQVEINLNFISSLSLCFLRMSLANK